MDRNISIINDLDGKQDYAERGSCEGKGECISGNSGVDRIATAPEYSENSKEKHKEDAKYGWYRYRVRFALPVYNDKSGELERYNIFRSVMLVRHAEDGKKYLYDILAIKKRNEQPA